MGRGPFFGSSRKMRGFPMNLSPGGLDPDGPPGFPYFATADGKFEFGGYGPGPFHPHDGPFFPGHPGHPAGPQGQPLPFTQPGKATVNFRTLAISVPGLPNISAQHQKEIKILKFYNRRKLLNYLIPQMSCHNFNSEMED